METPRTDEALRRHYSEGDFFGEETTKEAYEFARELERELVSKIERKELNQLTCYVVVEDDRGLGSTVEAVYADKVEADKHAASSSHLYTYESIFYLQNMGDV